MLLIVKQSTYQDKTFTIVIRDDKDALEQAPTYTIAQQNKLTGHQVTHTIDPLREPDKITATFDEHFIYIHFNDTVEQYATGYTYHVIKQTLVDGEPHYTQSNTVYTESLPQKLMYLHTVNPRVFLEDTLTLAWQPYKAEENPLAEGIGFYIATSPKGKHTWSTPERYKVSANEQPLLLSLNVPCYTFHLPQLVDTQEPKDIRLTAVILTSSSQSLLSNTVEISTLNYIQGLYEAKTDYLRLLNGSYDDTDKQVSKGQLIDPYYEWSLSNCFSEDVSVTCERCTAHEVTGDIVQIDYKVHMPIAPYQPTAFSFYLPFGNQCNYQVIINNATVAPSSYDSTTQTLSFAINASCQFSLIIRHTQFKLGTTVYSDTFAATTERLINRLPTWMKMRRQSNNSVGAYFLEVMGVSLEEISDLLAYYENQLYLTRADEEQLAYVYKAVAPHLVTSKPIMHVEGDGSYLEEAPNLAYFIKSDSSLAEEEHIYYNNLYFIDIEKGFLYSRKAYTPSDDAPYGYLHYHVLLDDDRVEQIPVKLEQHAMWNYFDEFGLLLGVERLSNETNHDYKKRLIDVFSTPSNSAREGLMHGIARELGIKKHIAWEDTTRDLILTDPMIITNEITINNKKIPLAEVWYNAEHQVVIKATQAYGDSCVVSYVSGLEMHVLHNKEDTVLQSKLFYPDNTATPLLMQYVERIKHAIPIEWDNVRWDSGYWDNVDEEACLPSIMDAQPLIY